MFFLLILQSEDIEPQPQHFLLSKDFPWLAELNRSIEAHQLQIQQLYKRYMIDRKSFMCPEPLKGPQALCKFF